MLFCPNVVLLHFAVGCSLMYIIEQKKKSWGCNIRSEYVEVALYSYDVV
jgi:hypothetical protein